LRAPLSKGQGEPAPQLFVGQRFLRSFRFPFGLSKPHASAATIFVDELDASPFEGVANGIVVRSFNSSAASNRAAHGPQELQLPHKPPRHDKNAHTDSGGEQHRENRTAHPTEHTAAIALNVLFISLSLSVLVWRA